MRSEMLVAFCLSLVLAVVHGDFLGMGEPWPGMGLGMGMIRDPDFRKAMELAVKGECEELAKMKKYSSLRCDPSNKALQGKSNESDKESNAEKPKEKKMDKKTLARVQEELMKHAGPIGMVDPMWLGRGGI